MNRIAVLFAFCAVPILAQDALRGHWSGNVEIPDHPLGIEADLDKTPANVWIGSISIPSQNSSGIPLDAISCSNGKCSFRIKGVPGDPTLTGTISADGKTMSGEFTQGPGSFPFKLTRTGDPKVETDKPSPPLDKEFLGTWEGALDVQGQTLRLVLKMSNGTAGGSAVMISVDQGGVEIPVNFIDQKGAKLKLEVKMVGGKYDAEINKDGTELSGSWTQGPGSLPLKLRKAADKK